MRRALALAALGCCVAFAVQAAQIDGEARPSDAHTLVIRGARITLLDMTPFAPTDTCGPEGAAWLCGDVSLRALEALIAGRHLTCDLVNKVGHGDFQGRCSTSDGADIAASMVAAGWARASDHTLMREQDAAKAAGSGAWGSRTAP